MFSDRRSLGWRKKIALYTQALLYVAAGTNHFLQSNMYAAIVPPPFPALLAVFSSGVAEIIFGLLLLFNSTRSIAGVGIILILILVFPANVYMTISYFKSGHPHAWLSVLRLPLQFLLIWLAWWSALKKPVG